MEYGFSGRAESLGKPESRQPRHEHVPAEVPTSKRSAVAAIVAPRPMGRTALCERCAKDNLARPCSSAVGGTSSDLLVAQPQEDALGSLPRNAIQHGLEPAWGMVADIHVVTRCDAVDQSGNSPQVVEIVIQANGEIRLQFSDRIACSE